MDHRQKLLGYYNYTVMVHVKNLRHKIEEDPQKPRHILTVWGKGYQFRKQETAAERRIL